MNYIAVGNRCAVNLSALKLPVSTQELLALLERKGFGFVDVDMITLARSYIGKAVYRRCASMREAPMVVDCASLIKWLYAQRGIWLPRDFFFWLELGSPVSLVDLRAGDLVFTDGHSNRVAENI